MNQRSRDIAKRFAAGVMLGIGGILPGLSGSVLAVAFGIYEKIIDAVASLFKKSGEIVRYLLPIGLGAGLGFYTVALVLRKALEKYETPLIFLFIGLIIGSMPSVISEAKKAMTPSTQKRCCVTAICGLLVSLLLLAVRRTPEAQAAAVMLPPQSFLTGLILTVGSILPGLSTSVVLFHLGWYAPMMAAFTSMDFSVLAWFLLGAATAAVTLVWLIRRLLKRHPGEIYALVVGLMTGSIIASCPRVAFDVQVLVYIACVAVGIACARIMARFE